MEKQQVGTLKEKDGEETEAKSRAGRQRGRGGEAGPSAAGSLEAL